MFQKINVETFDSETITELPQAVVQILGDASSGIASIMGGPYRGLRTMIVITRTQEGILLETCDESVLSNGNYSIDLLAQFGAQWGAVLVTEHNENLYAVAIADIAERN